MSADSSEPVNTKLGKMSKIDASWKATLDIWVGRFKKAQQEIRSLEDELDYQRQLNEAALDILTEDQLLILRQRLAGQYGPNSSVQCACSGDSEQYGSGPDGRALLPLASESNSEPESPHGKCGCN